MLSIPNSQSKENECSFEGTLSNEDNQGQPTQKLKCEYIHINLSNGV